MSTQFGGYPGPQAPPQQQPQAHPTVQYGLPGGPPAQVLPQGAQRVMPQGAQQPERRIEYGTDMLPPAPQNVGTLQSYVPQQQPPQPQQNYTPGNFYQQVPPQQSQQSAPQQYGQPAPPQRPVATADMILDGAGVPPELRGRPVGTAMQYIDGLAREVMASRRAAGGVPQQHQQQSPQQPPQQAQPGQYQPAQQGTFFQNPEQSIARAVAGPIAQAMAPIVQQNQQQAVRDALATAANNIPDFQQLAPHISQMLRGASPEILSNPEVWETAADMVRGRLIRSGQQPQQPNGQHVQQPLRAPAGMQAVPAYSFFTEAPTPPMPQTGYQLSQEELMYANRWGMTAEQFYQWKYGAQTVGGR